MAAIEELESSVSVQFIQRAAGKIDNDPHRALGITAADALTITEKAVSRPGQVLPRLVGIADAHPVVEPAGLLALQGLFRRSEGAFVVVGLIWGGQLGRLYGPRPP